MATEPDPPARRSVLATDNADQVRDFVGQTYGSWLLANRSGGGMSIKVTHTDAGSFGFTDSQMDADLVFDASDTPGVIVTSLTGGGVGAERGKATDRFGPGDMFISGAPGLRYLCHVHHHMTISAFVLPIPLFDGLLEPSPGQRPGPLTFLSQSPPDAVAAAARWQPAVSYSRNFVASPEAAGSPLLAGSAARLLAALTLETFPHTAVTDPTIEDRHDAHPDTLRRAVAFIDENAGTDITIADIAAACFVTVRAIELAFRRHLDTTPTGYLRRVRLDHTHHDLATADPAHESVTAVAYRWGFSSASRFAARYRSAYGVLPSHTLRSTR